MVALPCDASDDWTLERTTDLAEDFFDDDFVLWMPEFESFPADDPVEPVDEVWLSEPLPLPLPPDLFFFRGRYL